MLLSIEKLIYGGEGLARGPAGPDGRSLTVLVPFVLPDERIEAEVRLEKPGFARGTLTQLIEASPVRVEPRCRYFGQCGGCHYQHISNEQQLAFKAEILRETLQRIARIDVKSEIRLHASPAWNYRNRARFQVQTRPEFALGYFQLDSHTIVPVVECPISSPRINQVLARLTEQRGLNCPETVEEIEFFADAADETLLAWAFCSRDSRGEDLLRWAEGLRKEIPEIRGLSFFSTRRRGEGEGPADARRIAQAGQSELLYQVGNNKYRVSAGSFFQVNRHLIGDLVSVVTEGVGGDIAFDLYAGVGLFSQALGPKFHHIFAVEASQTAYADLMQNVPANVKVAGARAETYLRSRPVRKSPDLVVLDPPRTGVGKSVTGSLLALAARRIRYVSCDPPTLARDLALLLAGGYHVEEVHLFDMFPETFHIESVTLLAR